MDITLLKKHIQDYVNSLKEDDDKKSGDLAERVERATFYRKWTKERILGMSKEDLYEYLSRLWAMLIWGNKQYVVDKLISENGLSAVREELAELVWGKAPIATRWDRFRKGRGGRA